MKEYKLLLVDDDPFILEGIGEDLEKHGYQVTRAESGETAATLLNSETCTGVMRLVVVPSPSWPYSL